MPTLPVKRVALYKHGVGYFEREGIVVDEAALEFTFRQAEVSDVLKSLTVLDLNGGHIAAVNYDSTKPLERRLADVALTIPDQGSLVGLLPQLKGARISIRIDRNDKPFDCTLLGIDTLERQTGDGFVRTVLLSVFSDDGELSSFDLHELAELQLKDEHLRNDLDYYLRMQLASKKKESRAFRFLASGKGKRTVRLSYVVAAPVWKATYRLLLGPEGESGSSMIQGWAVVDNTQEEDWENVDLTLVAGLPVAFEHDLYTPRYVRRPVVAVRETTGVLPTTEEPPFDAFMMEMAPPVAAAAPVAQRKVRALTGPMASALASPSSVLTQVREREVGDLFEYHVERSVTIRRDQSALVPIVLKPFDGRTVLLYQKSARAENPMRCVEFKNTTGLTLEGGPVTVLEGGSYVGEAMLDTLKPGEDRLVAYAVELAVRVLDNIESHDEKVHKVVVRQGALRAEHAQVQTTTYAFSSKSPRDQVVYLDHPRPGGQWKLADTPQPHATTHNSWRFRFVIPAGQTTKYVVRQRQVLAQSFGLNDAGDSQLSLWIEQKYLNTATAEVLRKVVDLRQKSAGHDEQIRRLEQERETIHGEQKRIRDNLQALGDRPSEKELRERYLRTLTAQEDRLEQIATALRQEITARDQAHAAVAAALGGLDYEGML